MTSLVIVNGYDLMWHDVYLDPNDPNPFFFKEDSVQYLRDLATKGWEVLMYFGPIDEERERCPYGNNYDVRRILMAKKRVMIKIFSPHITVFDRPDEFFLHEFKYDLYSPSYFIIANSNRNYPESIARYSPIEIFGLVDPFPKQVDNIYVLFTYHYGRETNLYKNAPFASPNRNERREQLDHIKRENPNKNIIMIWSPRYRYTPGPKRHIFNLDFERPDQDNFPDILCYVQGS